MKAIVRYQANSYGNTSDALGYKLKVSRTGGSGSEGIVVEVEYDTVQQGTGVGYEPSVRGLVLEVSKAEAHIIAHTLMLASQAEVHPFEVSIVLGTSQKR